LSLSPLPFVAVVEESCPALSSQCVYTDLVAPLSRFCPLLPNYLKAAFNMNNKRLEPTERHVGGAIAEELGSSEMKGYTEEDRKDMWRMGKKQELR
jgi:hypothetical protein